MKLADQLLTNLLSSTYHGNEIGEKQRGREERQPADQLANQQTYQFVWHLKNWEGMKVTRLCEIKAEGQGSPFEPT